MSIRSIQDCSNMDSPNQRSLNAAQKCWTENQWSVIIAFLVSYIVKIFVLLRLTRRSRLIHSLQLVTLARGGRHANRLPPRL